MIDLTFVNSSPPPLNARNMNELVQTINNTTDQITYLSVYATPEMYGAVGDGLTDDTDAMQECLDSNDIIVLPHKTYVISKTLELRDGIHIYGTGCTL